MKNDTERMGAAVTDAGSERAQFEAWAGSKDSRWLAPHRLARSVDDGSYAWIFLNESWEVWQARAALAASATPGSGEAVAAAKEIEDLIAQRDHREEIIDDLCDAVLGADRAEWSSAYYFEDAVAEVLERMEELDRRNKCRESLPPAASAGDALTDEQIEAKAQRMAWRYNKSSQPAHSDTYTFNRTTLIEFARALTQSASGADGGGV